MAADRDRPPALDDARLRALGRELLLALGEDPDRPGLADTPRRWAAWWREFIAYDPGSVDVAFQHAETDQLIAVSGITVWSLCEHHLLPFRCELAIGYIADGRVLGLSKFGRLAHACAHRLQLQERLCQELADRVVAATGSPDVAVVGRGEHLCMTIRGIRTPSTMTTSVMRGLFRQEHAARAEFLALIRQQGAQHA